MELIQLTQTMSAIAGIAMIMIASAHLKRFLRGWAAK